VGAQGVHLAHTVAVARFFSRNGSFTSVKDVVRYFNAGVPEDAQAGAAATLTLH
jgi:hypothetical protein